ADEVDRPPYRGEVQPVGGADIAPEYLADMQRYAECELGSTLLPSQNVQMIHPCLRGLYGANRGIAGGSGVAFANREDRENAIPDKFQHLAAESVNGAGDAVEPGVERLHHVLGR